MNLEPAFVSDSQALGCRGVLLLSGHSLCLLQLQKTRTVALQACL